jgi:hypothetical protein
VRRVALFLIALLCGLPAAAQSDAGNTQRVAQAIASGPTAWVVKSVSGGATLMRPAAASVEFAAGDGPAVSDPTRIGGKRLFQPSATAPQTTSAI